MGQCIAICNGVLKMDCLCTSFSVCSTFLNIFRCASISSTLMSPSIVWLVGWLVGNTFFYFVSVSGPLPSFGEICDIWSQWWGDTTWPKKTYPPTFQPIYHLWHLPRSVRHSARCSHFHTSLEGERVLSWCRCVTQPIDGAVSQDSDTTWYKSWRYIFLLNFQRLDWLTGLINWIE